MSVENYDDEVSEDPRILEWSVIALDHTGSPVTPSKSGELHMLVDLHPSSRGDDHSAIDEDRRVPFGSAWSEFKRFVGDFRSRGRTAIVTFSPWGVYYLKREVERLGYPASDIESLRRTVNLGTSFKRHTRATKYVELEEMLPYIGVPWERGIECKGINGARNAGKVVSRLITEQYTFSYNQNLEDCEKWCRKMAALKALERLLAKDAPPSHSSGGSAVGEEVQSVDHRDVRPVPSVPVATAEEAAFIESLKKRQSDLIEKLGSINARNQFSEIHLLVDPAVLFPSDLERFGGLSPRYIELLSQDNEFLSSLQRATRLIFNAWGFDATSGSFVAHPYTSQSFKSALPVDSRPGRVLAVMGGCLKVFKLDDTFNRAKTLERAIHSDRRLHSSLTYRVKYLGKTVRVTTHDFWASSSFPPSKVL